MLISNPLTRMERGSPPISIRAHMTIAKASPKAWNKQRKTPMLFLRYTKTSQDR